MKFIQYAGPSHDDSSSIDIDTMYKHIFDDYQIYWFKDNSEAEIRYKENDYSASLEIGASKYGLFIHFSSYTTNEDKLSLFDKTKLNELTEVLFGLEVSIGLFLPQELAWKVIKEFLETGKASDKIEWISIDDMPEDGDYF